MNYSVYTDGGSRGNPGPAAIGIVIVKNGTTELELGKTIGVATNNTAEYTAVIEALTWISEHSATSSDAVINFYLDSTLVVNQINGLFKIKQPSMRDFVDKVHLLESEIPGQIRYSYIPRERNRKADLLVNQALDRAAHVTSR
jgi:ribonuclease HI